MKNYNEADVAVDAARTRSIKKEEDLLPNSLQVAGSLALEAV